MEYNVNGHLMLDLGLEGYVLDFAGRNFYPSKNWEKINTWIEHFSPAVRLLLLPWCLGKARIIGRDTGLSTGAVIILTAIASMIGYPPFYEIKLTLRWPNWIIKKHLTKLIQSGYLYTRVIDEEVCYLLTLNAKISILVSKPIDDPDLPSYVNYVGKTDMAYHRMINLMLHQNNEEILPVSGYETGHYFAPIGNVNIGCYDGCEPGTPVLDNSDAVTPMYDDSSSQTKPELEDSRSGQLLM